MPGPSFRYRDRRSLLLRVIAALAASLLVHGLIVIGVKVRRFSDSHPSPVPLSVRIEPRVERVEPSPGVPAAQVTPSLATTAETPTADRPKESSPAPIVTPGSDPPKAAALPLAIDPTYYTWREVDVPAKLLGEGNPPYPREAEDAHVSGSVRIEVWIDETGKVTDAQVLSAVPPRVFDEATLSHYRGLRFAPAMKEGVAVRNRLRFGVEFGAEPRAGR